MNVDQFYPDIMEIAQFVRLYIDTIWFLLLTVGTINVNNLSTERLSCFSDCKMVLIKVCFSIIELKINEKYRILRVGVMVCRYDYHWRKFFDFNILLSLQ